MKLEFFKYTKKDGSQTAWLCNTTMGTIVAHKDLADGNAIKAEIEANGARQSAEGTIFVGYGSKPVATAAIEITSLAVSSSGAKVELPDGFINFK